MNDFNNGFIFDCSDMRMKFITREVLQNNVFKASNTQVSCSSSTRLRILPLSGVRGPHQSLDRVLCAGL